MKNYTHPIFWNHIELQFLSEYYGKVTIKELIEKYLPNRTSIGIKSKARLLGLKSSISKMRLLQGPKYSHDINFFSIANEINSYWAGFIAADGNINDCNSGIRLNCTLKDRDHVVKLKQVLRATNPIKIYKGSTEATKNTDYYHLNIDSAYQLANDLKRNFNIIPRKSLILEPPNIQHENEIRAFIRGYFDGDGWITRGKPGVQIGFCGTKSYMEWIRNQLVLFTNCRPGNINFHNNIYRLRFCGNKNNLKILVWLYFNRTTNTFLTRKHDRFLEYYKLGNVPELIQE